MAELRAKAPNRLRLPAARIVAAQAPPPTPGPVAIAVLAAGIFGILVAKLGEAFALIAIAAAIVAIIAVERTAGLRGAGQRA
jgi:hypothetical protein